MKVVTKKINNYDAVIFKTKKYTTIHLDYIFLNEFTLYNFILFNLLTRYMVNTNSKYKTKKELDDVKAEHYSFSLSLITENYTDDLIVKASLELINPKLVKDDYFDALMDVGCGFLFKPNFENNRLDKKVFEVIKKEVINDFESRKKSIYRKVEDNFYESVFGDSFFTRTNCSLDEFIRIVNSITDKDIIKAHDTLINKSFKKLFVMGDITNKNIESLKKIKFKHITNKELVYNKLKINPINDYVEYNFKGNQSMIKAMYEVKNFEKKDKFILTVINKLLNRDGRILQNVFRNDLKIVYYSGSYVNNRMGYLIIEADIDAENKDKFIDGLDAIFGQFNNKKLIEESLLICKKNIKDALYILDENKFDIKTEFLDKYLYNYYTFEELYENVQKISYEDIIGVLNRLERRIIHFAKATNK